MVNLIEPGTMYGDRLNEVDFRIAKLLRFGRTRTNVGVDVYNVFNANPALTYNAAYSTALPFPRPTGVLTRASRRSARRSTSSWLVVGGWWWWFWAGLPEPLTTTTK